MVLPVNSHSGIGIMRAVVDLYGTPPQFIRDEVAKIHKTIAADLREKRKRGRRCALHEAWNCATSPRRLGRARPLRPARRMETSTLATWRALHVFQTLTSRQPHSSRSVWTRASPSVKS
jgi:hypothetical protein